MHRQNVILTNSQVVLVIVAALLLGSIIGPMAGTAASPETASLEASALDNKATFAGREVTIYADETFSPDAPPSLFAIAKDLDGNVIGGIPFGNACPRTTADMATTTGTSANNWTLIQEEMGLAFAFTSADPTWVHVPFGIFQITDKWSVTAETRGEGALVSAGTFRCISRDNAGTQWVGPPVGHDPVRQVPDYCMTSVQEVANVVNNDVSMAQYWMPTGNARQWVFEHPAEVVSHVVPYGHVMQFVYEDVFYTSNPGDNPTVQGATLWCLPLQEMVSKGWLQ
jgi:hypothetical protein